MGHAIMYQIFFKEKSWHITIGNGKPVINLKKFTIKILPIFGFFLKITEDINRYEKNIYFEKLYKLCL